MEQQQQRNIMGALLRAVAASSGVSAAHFTQEDRVTSFQTLQDVQHRYDNRLALAVQLLLAERHFFDDNKFDVTVPTKLLALEILNAFLQKGHYATVADTDRIQLRQAVLQAARLLVQNNHNTNDIATTTTTTTILSRSDTRILANKLAAVLEGIVVRDFPQHWSNFFTQVFAPLSQGGLWYDDPSSPASVPQQATTVRLLLQCLQLIAEDCTDADYNAKISTQRRNQVLMGLNEVARQTVVPLLYQLLATHYPLLLQTKSQLHAMHQYLIQQRRTVAQMTLEEATQYQAAVALRHVTGDMLFAVLTTLTRFAASMDVAWLFGTMPTTSNAESNSNNQQQQSQQQQPSPPEFITALLHLLREPEQKLQVQAAAALEELALRGSKMEAQQWIRLLADLPPSLHEAAMQAQTAAGERAVARQVGATVFADDEDASAAAQWEFHRAVTRTMSVLLSSHMSLIHAHRNILTGKGSDYERFSIFCETLVELLHHPWGRVASEQIQLWTTFLRDPQMTKARLLQRYAPRILQAFMLHLVKIRWDDVEEGTHPNARLLEAVFDDEEQYDAWMSDLRSRSSLMLKFLGHVEPSVSAQALAHRWNQLVNQHGQGLPLNHLDAAHNQLTPLSDAVLQFESFYQPLENVLAGISAWTMVSDDNNNSTNNNNHNPPQVPKDYEGPAAHVVRNETQAALASIAQSMVAWNPPYVWLQFRRATLLECLRHYWKYQPATLLVAVDSLIRYLGLPDEWANSAKAGGGGAAATTVAPPTNDWENVAMSGEMISLKKKSGVTLVAVAKHVPHHLVPWLSQLSTATGTLLSSTGLIPMNQMHLYEFLSCVATAVDDPTQRANFIQNVLSHALQELESPATQQNTASTAALLHMMGIAPQAAENPRSVTDPTHVKSVTTQYFSLFNALNRLLSVGKRCNEAVRRQGGGVLVRRSGQPTPPSNADPGQFLEEGPISLRDLAIADPFVPLWPRIVPTLLRVYAALLGAWRPEQKAILLRNPLQRYAYAISDDEAFLAKNHDKSSGGVFGEGGTAGSVFAGADRRDVHLVPKWSSWWNELRNTCCQMFGLLATSRALYSPELAGLYPTIVATLADPINLQSMEHRHFTQFFKQVVEMLCISCPATLYATHLEPILGPILAHVKHRLECTWAPILNPASIADPLGRPSPTRAVSSEDAERVADLASRGGEAWFAWYYCHGGLFVGDLDAVTAEAAVEKQRVELSRSFSDCMQVALALKGDWALVLANQAREEQASKRNDIYSSSSSSKLTAIGGARNRPSADAIERNADGSPKHNFQALIDARKVGRINGLCHFMLLENEGIAGNLTLTVIQCLAYPDAYTSRRITKICHRILETVAWSPAYTQMLGDQMFRQILQNVVTEPKWMVGLEWDMINVVRDIYCRLVLGQTLQPGGQGPGQQQPSMGQNSNRFEQAKTVDAPLQGGGVLMAASDAPRQLLAGIPGIGAVLVQDLERKMNDKRSAKDQKDAVRDLLRIASDNVRDTFPPAAGGAAGSDALGAAASLFDRAEKEESLLHKPTNNQGIAAVEGGATPPMGNTKGIAARRNAVTEASLSAFVL